METKDELEIYNDRIRKILHDENEVPTKDEDVLVFCYLEQNSGIPCGDGTLYFDEKSVYVFNECISKTKAIMRYIREKVNKLPPDEDFVNKEFEAYWGKKKAGVKWCYISDLLPKDIINEIKNIKK